MEPIHTVQRDVNDAYMHCPTNDITPHPDDELFTIAKYSESSYYSDSDSHDTFDSIAFPRNQIDWNESDIEDDYDYDTIVDYETLEIESISDNSDASDSESQSSQEDSMPPLVDRTENDDSKNDQTSITILSSLQLLTTTYW